MTVKLFKRTSCVVAASTLTLLVSVGAQPALAASGPTSAETMPVSGGIVDENLSPLVSSAARLLKERTRSARHLIKHGKVKAALTAVNAAQDSAGAIRTLMPFVAAVEQLEEAKRKLRMGDLSLFRRDLMRIYARLDEMSIFAPDVATRAKARLMDAERNADMWKLFEAGKLVDETRNEIAGSAVYIPAIAIYTELAAAHLALSAPEPDLASAETAVRNADELIGIVVTSARGRPRV